MATHDEQWFLFIYDRATVKLKPEYFTRAKIEYIQHLYPSADPQSSAAAYFSACQIDDA
jgi:hypothetical protein